MTKRGKTQAMIQNQVNLRMRRKVDRNRERSQPMKQKVMRSQRRTKTSRHLKRMTLTTSKR